jgi:hypothetical protein
MKSAELKVGTKYGVIPAWDYSSSDKKNPDRVQRNHVANATLVSTDKYEYKVYRSDNQTDAQFAPANKGSRNIGYLVCSDDYKNNGQASTTIFWLARPQDIVAEYTTLEPKWAERERQELLAKQKHEAERAEQERKQKEAREYHERVSASLIASLKTIIGDRANNITVDQRNRRVGDNYIEVSEMSIDLKTMSILIEKVLEAKDLVG